MKEIKTEQAYMRYGILTSGLLMFIFAPLIRVCQYYDHNPFLYGSSMSKMFHHAWDVVLRHIEYGGLKDLDMGYWIMFMSGLIPLCLILSLICQYFSRHKPALYLSGMACLLYLAYIIYFVYWRLTDLDVYLMPYLYGLTAYLIFYAYQTYRLWLTREALSQ